jgi:hypothetical protein
MTEKTKKSRLYRVSIFLVLALPQLIWLTKTAIAEAGPNSSWNGPGYLER